MNDKIKKFIENEREIAEYKLSLLRLSKKRLYTERLIIKEQEYINFPFENLCLESVEEARTALTLFRVDRFSFDKKYSIKRDARIATTSQISSLKSRLLYLEEKYRYLINTEIQSVDLAKYSLKNKNNGALFNKAKARVQILICCLARYLFSEIKELNSYEFNELDQKHASDLKKSIDRIYDRAIYEIFKYYNDSIDQTYQLLRGTDGENEFIPSIYPIINLFDKFPENKIVLSRVLPIGKSFFSKTGKPIVKKSSERGFSIATPLNRVGNETVDLLYRNIYSESNVCLDQILEKNFYNIKAGDNTYVKALSTIPVWKFLSETYDPYLSREIFRLLGLSGVGLQTVDLSDPAFVEAVNNSNFSININPDMSKMLIAATRSESDKLADAKKYIDLLIKDLKEEYNNKFLTNIFESSKNDSRKYKIIEIAGSIK